MLGIWKNIRNILCTFVLRNDISVCVRLIAFQGHNTRKSLLAVVTFHLAVALKTNI